jgi:hypothetical protein
VEQVCALLQQHGYDAMGEQVMYKGETGERITGFMFFGCAMYQRVKQMVDDKHHARARGPVHILTQQPVEGRSKDGGFRVGDMERDCIQGHGAAHVAWDRFFQQSDFSEWPLCSKCHLIAMGTAPPDQRALIVGRNETSGYCMNCKTAGTTFNVPLPAATKLFSMELMTAHVRTEFLLDPYPDTNPFSSAAAGLPRDPVAERALLQPAVRASRQRSRDEFGSNRPLKRGRASGDPWAATAAPSAYALRGGVVTQVHMDDNGGNADNEDDDDDRGSAYMPESDDEVEPELDDEAASELELDEDVKSELDDESGAASPVYEDSD